MGRIRNSCGFWSLTPGKLQGETTEELTKRVLHELDWLVDGFEYHYDFEINESNYGRVRRILGEKDIYAIGLYTPANPHFDRGAFTSPSEEYRRENAEITKRAIDLASEARACLIIWPGREGYSYPFQVSYTEIWNLFIDGLAEITEYANGKGVPIVLEPSESKSPRGLLMRDIGMAIFVIHKVGSRGVDTSNLKINMDWQDLIISGDNLAESAALLAQEKLLGHLHANAGCGRYPEFRIPGSAFFIETLELACVLRDVGYGDDGKRVGFDIVPFGENPISAMRAAILHWEYIYELAGKLDREQLAIARRDRNGVLAQEAVYAALGLDRAFTDMLRKAKS